MKPFALLLLLALHTCTHSAESPTPPFPLWNNIESVETYAQRVNLPLTQTLDLGNGVKLELVLIPAGKFIMGTPEPPEVDVAAFNQQIHSGQALLWVCSSVLLVTGIVTVIRSFGEKRRLQLSLARLLWVTVWAGGAVMSAMHWQYSMQALEQAKWDYAADLSRYYAAEPEEKPAHTVTLTKPFYMSKFPVTQKQYEAVMGSNPSHFKGKNLPVENVSWYDAQKFYKAVSTSTQQTLRLPTEAEWEYACRAGTTTRYYSGDTTHDLNSVAWYNSNSGNQTHPVGQKLPNAFGLYDMLGNVWTWCEDWHTVDYTGAASVDPYENRYSGYNRAMRGGSWINMYKDCRVTHRDTGAPSNFDSIGGFRIVLLPAFKAP